MIANYTTKVDVKKTVGEIQQILVKGGAQRVAVNFDVNGLPVAIEFTVTLNGQDIYFSLPGKHEGVLKVLIKKAPRSFHNKEQALRVSWRIVKDWTRAQMALIEAGCAEISEVFLPYALNDKGQTFFDSFKSTQLQLTHK